MIFYTEKKIIAAQVKKYESYLLADELRQSSDDLTRMARVYSVTGDERFKAYFQEILDIRNGVSPRPEHYGGIYWDLFISTGVSPGRSFEPISLKSLMKRMGFTEKEFSYLRQTQIQSDRLVKLEEQAMNAMVGLYKDSSGDYTKKGVPDKNLAQKLLHGHNYHKAKAQIMKPLKVFFDAIDKRTSEEISYYTEKNKNLGIMLIFIMSLTIILLLVSLLLIVFLKNQKQSKKEQAMEESTGLVNIIYQLFTYNWPFLMACIVATAMISVFAWWSHQEIRYLSRKEAEKKMSLALHLTHSSLTDWFEKEKLKGQALVKALDKLLSQNKYNLNFPKEKWQDFYRGVLSEDLDGYVLLDLDGTVISSNKSVLVDQNLKSLVSQRFLKEIQTAPYYTAFEVPKAGEKKSLLTNEILLGFQLLKKDKQPYALVILMISPHKKLGAIPHRGFFGNTGEIFAVNSKGRYMTESRWAEKLGELQLVDEKDPSSFGIQVTEDIFSHVSLGKSQPFTLAVRQVLKREKGSTLQSYKNPFGDFVVGAWLWDNAYNFGLVAEIHEEEAFALSEKYKRELIVGSVISILLIIILTVMFVWIRIRIAKVNRQLQNAYTEIESHNKKFLKDLEFGKRVQMGMLPNPLEGKNFKIYAFLEPARGVSGDFYDFFLIDDGKLYFTIGDVSGKGIPAALFMVIARSFLKKTVGATLEPNIIMDKTNKELSINNDSCMFITLIVGILDLHTGQLTFTNAGHNPPYIKKKDGSLTCLKHAHGPMVGTFEDVDFTQRTVTLEKGDVLFLYTDGVTEAMNTRQEFYGDERLEEVLKTEKTSCHRTMVSKVSKSLSSFAEATEQSDDITMVSVQYF